MKDRTKRRRKRSRFEGDYGSSPIASKAIGGEGWFFSIIITCANVSDASEEEGVVVGYLAR